MAPRGRAQQPTMPLIGYLGGGSGIPPDSMAAFHDRLKSFGYIADRNVTTEYRLALGQYDRPPALAADLVARQVSVIVAVDSLEVASSKRAIRGSPNALEIGTVPLITGRQFE